MMARRSVGGAAEAQRLRRAGQNKEAETAYRAHLKANPEDADAWRGLGLALIGLNRLDDAAYCFWQALQYRPDSLPLLMQLGDLLVRAGDMKRAATVYATIIEKFPGEARAYLSLSAIQRELGEIEVSRQTLKIGLCKRPISVQSCLGAPKARILRLRGVQNAFYKVAPEGSHWLRLSGGNFSSSALWDQNQFTTINFLISDENILSHEGIPAHDIVVNSVADADLEGQSLETAARYLARNPGMPVINDPARVLESTRDNNYRRLKEVPGIRFPKSMRAEVRPDVPFDAAEFLSREGLELPVILRRTGTHTAVSTVKADSLPVVEDYFLTEGAGTHYVIEYVLSPFREDYFRKMRVFFIDGELYPVVHHVDTVWNVHGFNRTTVMAETPWMTDLEEAYLDDPAAYVGADAFAALNALPKISGLDFFGVDFDVMEDGRILIFETNPAMRHSFEHARNFPYLEPHARRITDAFQNMILSRALPAADEKPVSHASDGGRAGSA
ncbi:MAG: hypothetical protein CMM10_04905 [Rhodospirillaceae bacterium]|jgi:tetratricopeptide (TPR) repeat protein|nr:hypothetical protein [Rhodospirillaceae bacterium]MDP6645555.1 tetratricopeptide repeat protein [Rhodospirillales bacterium]